MRLFTLRVPFGPNLLSAGIYPLRERAMLCLWPLNRRFFAIPLPDYFLRFAWNR